MYLTKMKIYLWIDFLVLHFLTEQQETHTHLTDTLEDLPRVQQHLWHLDYVQRQWEQMAEVVADPWVIRLFYYFRFYSFYFLNRFSSYSVITLWHCGLEDNICPDRHGRVIFCLHSLSYQYGLILAKALFH